MKKSTLNSSAGFSLVELMVVVAIIGILAAMSVGQVQKQIAKARQSEAKTNLAALFSAENAFRSEYNTYITDFGVMKLEYGGNLRYGTGFSANSAPVATAQAFGYSLTAFSNNAFDAASYCATPTAQCTMMPEAQAVPATPAPTQNTFTAGAASDIYTGGQLDHWTMNESKQLVQVLDGIQ